MWVIVSTVCSTAFGVALAAGVAFLRQRQYQLLPRIKIKTSGLNTVHEEDDRSNVPVNTV